MKPKAGSLKRLVKLISIYTDWLSKKKRRLKLPVSGMKRLYYYRLYGH